MLTDAAPALTDLTDGDTLFRRYYPFIVFLARRRLEFAAPSDRAFGVDDLAQEIAAAVYRGRHYFCPERGRLTTWIARMAGRTAGMVRKATAAAKRGGPGRAGAGRGLTSPLRGEVNEPRAEPEFWDGLARLVTPIELRALVLRFVEDVDLKEIGARLCPNCVGRSREARASRILDGALKKLHRRRFDLRRALGLV